MEAMKLNRDYGARSPRVSRIAVVDDDEAARKTLVELVQSEYPKLTVRGFESLFDCYCGVMSFDYILMDISSVCPATMLDMAGRAWAPIGKYASEYPRTEFVLITAMSSNACQDVIDDCVSLGGVERSRMHVGGFMWESKSEPRSIKRTLNQLIKPEDCEWTRTLSKARAVCPARDAGDGRDGDGGTASGCNQPPGVHRRKTL